MTSLASISDKNGSLVISGELNFKTVMKLWKDSQSLLGKFAALHFDLGEVTSSNSAGVALLLEWVKYAKRNNKPIDFSNVPIQLNSIMAVSGLSQTLNSLSLK